MPTLRATSGTWSGVGPTAYAYAWYRDGAPISGATEVTYTTTIEDEGTELTVLVTATNVDGTANATSLAYEVAARPANTVAPLVTGDTSAGDVLSTTDGTWTGTLPIAYSYQWRRDGVDLTGETASTYTLVEADELTDIDVVVTATNVAASVSVGSNVVPIPSGVVVVTITGIVEHGNVLTATGATTYQWYAGGVAISGETGSTYTVDRAEGAIGPDITCVGDGSITSNALSYYPAQLSGIRAVWDFGRGTTLSGGYITAVADQSPAGNNIAAPTLANAPLYTAADPEFGGQPTATFDGIDDYLITSGVLTMGGGGTYLGGTAIMPTRLIENVNGRTVYHIGSAYTSQVTAERFQSYWGAGAAATTATGILRTRPSVFEASWDGSNASNFLNGTQTTPAAWTTPTTEAVFSFGASNVGASFSNIKLPMLCILNRALTSSERADFNSYFAWRFPQRGVDLFSAGTFTRSTEASYLTAAPTSGSSPYLSWAAANVRRIENRGDGLGRMLLTEGARTNLLERSAEFTDAVWASSGITITADTTTAPDGTTTADTFVSTAGAARHIYNTTSDASTGVCSIFEMDGDRPWRMAIRDGGGTYRPQGEAEFVSSAGVWARRDAKDWPGAVSGTGRVAPVYASNVDLNIRTGYFWGAQYEIAQWPSSYIRTAGSATTRGADVFTHAVGAYPASFCTTGFRFTFAPDFSSTELISVGNSSHVLVGFTTGTFHRVEFRVSGGNVIIRVFDGASAILASATPLTWSVGQDLTFEVEPSAGSVSLSGFTTGDGTTIATAWTFASDVLRIGAAGNGTLPVFGRFGQYIEAL